MKAWTVMLMTLALFLTVVSTVQAGAATESNYIRQLKIERLKWRIQLDKSREASYSKITTAKRRVKACPKCPSPAKAEQPRVDPEDCEKYLKIGDEYLDRVNRSREIYDFDSGITSNALIVIANYTRYKICKERIPVPGAPPASDWGKY